MGKPTSRKRRGEGRWNIRRVMTVVALVAVGLALTRGMNPMYLGAFGPLVVVLLWLFYTGVIERRQIEGFHYATAVVAIPASGFLARQIALGNFRLFSSTHWAAMVNHLVGGILSLMLGLAVGVAVRRLEEARGWDLAPFFRGAVIGTFVAIPIMLFFFDQDSMNDPNSSDRFTALGILGAGFAIGGVVELVRS